MFYARFTLIGSWEGKKNFGVGIFLNKNLLRKGYRKQTTFFLGLMCFICCMDKVGPTKVYGWQGSMLRVNLWPQASKNSQKQLRASKKRPQLVLQAQ